MKIKWKKDYLLAVVQMWDYGDDCRISFSDFMFFKEFGDSESEALQKPWMSRQEKEELVRF